MEINNALTLSQTHLTYDHGLLFQLYNQLNKILTFNINIAHKYK